MLNSKDIYSPGEFGRAEKRLHRRRCKSARELTPVTVFKFKRHFAFQRNIFSRGSQVPIQFPRLLLSRLNYILNLTRSIYSPPDFRSLLVRAHRIGHCGHRYIM